MKGDDLPTIEIIEPVLVTKRPCLPAFAGRTSTVTNPADPRGNLVVPAIRVAAPSEVATNTSRLTHDMRSCSARRTDRDTSRGDAPVMRLR